MESVQTNAAEIQTGDGVKRQLQASTTAWQAPEEKSASPAQGPKGGWKKARWLPAAARGRPEPLRPPRGVRHPAAPCARARADPARPRPPGG